MIYIIDELFVLVKFVKFSFEQFGPWDYFVGIDRSEKTFLNYHLNPLILYSINYISFLFFLIFTFYVM